MATLSKHKGRYAIQVGPRKSRKTIRLGAISRSDAETVRGHVRNLESYRGAAHPLSLATAHWLNEIGDVLHGRLVKAGLVSARAIAGGIGAYFDRYIASRTDLKPATISNLKQTRREFVAFFGAKRELTTITQGDISDWHRQLKVDFATATVSMHVKKARQVFTDAVSRRIITENPLKGIKAGSMANAERQQYVPCDDVAKVIDACPDAEWRLIFALARFGGLRVPSEIHALRWSDVHWDNDRITVRSSKTEHHQGKATRDVPIFPRLLPYLLDAKEVAEAGAVHVIARHRGDNLRTRAERIIDRAGLVQWERLFQNLRSSCETDLTASFPLHVVCAWIGNTEGVALRHYLQVTDEHFKLAACGLHKSAGKSGGSSDAVKPTFTVHETQNAPKIEAFCGASVPPRGVENLGEIAGILRNVAKAQAKALVKAHRAIDRERRRDLNNLKRAIARARGGRR